MNDISLAAKYRPRCLEDVIGQDVVVKSVKNALENNSLHHAYIFAGKYGCGKTSMARILAAMLNCRSGPTSKPCGTCDNCSAIFAGKSLDVKELDAASNRQIDDIRALKDEIRYQPADANKKVVIIDEVHSLTGQAAEAALKMIEEPPPHVIFILATTDPHKMKDTIHSRCITFKFYRVNWSVMHQHLVKMADAEGIKYEDDALKICARAADGSVRNAIQNLQTVMNFVGGDVVTFEAAKNVLSAIDDNLYFKLVSSIVKVETIEAVQTVEKLMADGRDAVEVLDGLYEHLRRLMIAKTCQKDLEGLGFTEDDGKRYCHQVGESGLELVLEMMNLCIDVSRGLNLNLDPQTLIEKFMIDSVVAKRRLDAKRKS